MSSRVTRSSAKQSGHSSPPHQDIQDDPDPPRPLARSSRKRKAPGSNDASQAEDSKPSPAGDPSSRPIKRSRTNPKPSTPSSTSHSAPQDLAASSSSSSHPSDGGKRGKSKSTAGNMSSRDDLASPLQDDASATSASAASSRKKSKTSRKSSTQSSKGRNKASPTSAASAKGVAKPQEEAATESASSGSPDEEDEEAEEDEESAIAAAAGAPADPFGAGLPNLLGRRRGGPLGAFSDLRAVSSLLGGSGRFNGLLSDLQQNDDPTTQYSALETLSELLLMSNEDNLASGRFSPDAFMPELVKLMQDDGPFGPNPEMMNVACRCVANMVEALPASVGAIVRHGAVPVLIHKLQAIEYMDVAEQALSTLEKISTDIPREVASQGGLVACLQYLDFFATGTQRSAVTIAANCSRGFPHDRFADAKSAMEILLSVLSSSDQKVMEQGCICISRLVDSFRGDASRLEELVTADLLKAILRLLLPGSTNLIGPNIHTQFLRLLSSVAAASRPRTVDLFKMDIVDTLYQILTGVSPPSGQENVAQKIDSVVIMQALIHRPKDHVFETLNVICELLPPLDDESMGYMKPLVENLGLPSHLPLARDATRGSSPGEQPPLTETCAPELRRFAIVLLPTLTDAYASTVNLNVRQRVLTAQLKMLSSFSADILEAALKPVPYASFLAAILSQQDHPFLVTAALQASALLMKRLESIYRFQFYREGVVAEIKTIADRTMRIKEATPPPSRSAAPEEQAEPSADADRSEGGSRRQRRGDDDDDAGDGDGYEDEDEHEHDLDEMDEDEDDDSDDSVPQIPHHAMSVSAIDTAHDLVTTFAKQFMQQFESSASREVRHRAHKLLLDVQSLMAEIADCYDNRDGEGGKELFAQLAKHFEGDALQSMTSYELLTSKVVDTLVDIFQSGAASSNASVGAEAAFVEAFMGTSLQNYVKTAGVDSPTTPFSVLVQKLQALLSRAEHFEVTTVYHNAFESNRASAASMLAKQLRIRLVADDENSGIPVTFRFIKVTIHAIATFQALNEYLQPKLALADRPNIGPGSTILPSRPSADPVESSARGSSQPDPASGQGETVGGSSRRPSEVSRSVAALAAAAATPSAPSAPSEKARSKRAERRSKAQQMPDSALEQILADAQNERGGEEALECADEDRVEDEDEADDDGGGGEEEQEDDDNDDAEGEDEDMDVSDAMEQIVDELEEEAREGQGDPSAVNVEVASTGKATARNDEGERIPTPTQTPTPAARQALHQRPMAGAGLRSLLGAPHRTMSYANAVRSPPTWHLEFSMNGKAINHDTTIYGAVQAAGAQDDGSAPSRQVWSNEHTIHFKRAEGATPPAASSPNSPEAEAESDGHSLPPSLERNPETASILRLLRQLHAINSNLDDVLADSRPASQIKAEPVAQFVNTKLTAKLNRQLEEPLIVASNCLPGWSEDLARLHPFLFPFETRHLFLQSTSFGYSRSMTRWQNAAPPMDPRRASHHERPFLGRLQRQKIRIQRSKMLESAVKVMELYGSKPHLLEVEYSDEVGTGLGPTLEFYSTVSKEFSKKRLRLWRDNESSREDEYVFGKNGLFPAPMSEQQLATANGQKILNLFKTLGIFVARSMLDSRIIDVAFNATFFRVDGGDKAVKPSLGAVKTVDESLANSLQTLRQFAVSKKKIDENERLSGAQKARKIAGIQVAGASIDDLGLDFTLPGYPHIELIDKGSNVNVDINNVSDYVERVIEYTLQKGVFKQVEAFRAGFSQVFPYSALKAFTPDELVMLFGRAEEDWRLETLMDSIKADHGYNLDSASVRNLLQIMSELSRTERREFLQFVTGSPKLPIGGFKSLTPMLTVVLRPAEAGSRPDATLPSVMTCQNYVKLPNYSSLEVMRERTMMAIRDGAGAFHLS